MDLVEGEMPTPEQPHQHRIKGRSVMNMAKKAKPEVKNRFFIPRDGKYVNVEDLPQEEQDLIRKNFSEQLADAMMEGFGYTRVTPSGKKTTA